MTDVKEEWKKESAEIAVLHVGDVLHEGEESSHNTLMRPLYSLFKISYMRI